jgi:hypothetical protein
MVPVSSFCLSNFHFLISSFSLRRLSRSASIARRFPQEAVVGARLSCPSSPCICSGSAFALALLHWNALPEDSSEASPSPDFNLFPPLRQNAFWSRRKRELNKDHIKRLSRRFHVSPELFF